MRFESAAIFLAGAMYPTLANSNVQILPAAADPDENRFQPLTDFDKDSCYYTWAIDARGRTNAGLDGSRGPPSHRCRDAARIAHNNVYSRKRCNNGWCAIMYEYYFEKDSTGLGIGGHAHEWENIVVFVRGGRVRRVAPSCHGRYKHASSIGGKYDDGNDGGSDSDDSSDDDDDDEKILFEGDRPKLVYHKDGAGTHCWRLAKMDDDPPENETGGWLLGNLTGWDHWPPGPDGVDLKLRLFETWSGKIAPKFWDWKDVFATNLKNAAGGRVPDFDSTKDE